MIFKGFISIKEEQNNNIFRSILSQINGYFKLKPTSQICLEYQEALLIDSKHGNFVEVIFENLYHKKIEIFEMSPFVYLLLSLFANEKTKLFQTAMRRN